MRSRIVKPRLFKNDKLARCPFPSRYLFIGLWGLCDRNGNLEDNPLKIKAEVLPFDNVDVESLIAPLVEAGLLQRYVVDGNNYLHVPSFLRHGHPHHSEVAEHPLFPGVARDSGKLQSSLENSGQKSAISVSIPCLLSSFSVSSPSFSASAEGSDPEIQRPSPPKGKYDPLCESLPAALESPAFRRAWSDWIAYRRSRSLSIRQPTVLKQIEFLEPLGAEVAAASIDQSIRNGWIGLFEVKGTPAHGRGPARKRLLSEEEANAVMRREMGSP